jgi:hypothetical protein
VRVRYIFEMGGTLYTRPYAELREITVQLDPDRSIWYKDKRVEHSPFPDILKKKYAGKYNLVTYVPIGTLPRNEVYHKIAQALQSA